MTIMTYMTNHRSFGHSKFMRSYDHSHNLLTNQISSFVIFKIVDRSNIVNFKLNYKLKFSVIKLFNVINVKINKLSNVINIKNFLMFISENLNYLTAR